MFRFPIMEPSSGTHIVSFYIHGSLLHVILYNNYEVFILLVYKMCDQRSLYSATHTNTQNLGEKDTEGFFLLQQVVRVVTIAI